jgi:hypothetical protein
VKLVQRKWRGVFDDANKLIGIVERVAEGRWYVYAGGLFIGTVPAAEEAAELIARVNAGGGDRERR